MRKGEMVQRMAAERGGTISQADATVEAMLAIRTEALQQGAPVTLRQCGPWQCGRTLCLPPAGGSAKRAASTQWRKTGLEGEHVDSVLPPPLPAGPLPT
jgi:hypothetical protein